MFLLQSSLNRCKEESRSVAYDRLKVVVAHLFIANNDRQSFKQMEDLLEPRMASSLVDIFDEEIMHVSKIDKQQDHDRKRTRKSLS